MSALEIRQFCRSDWEGIAECLRSLTECPPVNLKGLWIREALSWRDENVFCLVATIDDKIVGTGSLLIEPKLTRGGCLAGHIEDVAVHPDHRGKKIGLMLVQALVSLAREHGCYKVILDCDPSVVSFYEKSGFHTNGVCMRLNLDLEGEREGK